MGDKIKLNEDPRMFDNPLARSNRELFGIDPSKLNTDNQDSKKIDKLFAKTVSLVTRYLINLDKKYSKNDVDRIIGMCGEIDGAVTDYFNDDLDYEDLKDLIDQYELDLSKIKKIDPNSSWLFGSFLGSWQSVVFCIVLIISFVMFFCHVL
jgi:hypothetical protein